MDHHLAAQFNLAVDAIALPKYYGLSIHLPHSHPPRLTHSPLPDFIRHPLCLNDIRFHLTAGLYQEDIPLFYRYPPSSTFLCLSLSLPSTVMSCLSSKMP
jgi:hypothetical protein